MAEPNNCHHLLDSLSNYLDGEISDALCAEIERHIADCNNCRVVVDTLRQTIQLYHTLPDPDLPEAARERLYELLDLTDFLPES